MLETKDFFTFNEIESNLKVADTQRPTPHGDKLQALLKNEKLPSEDIFRVKDAIEKYSDWIRNMKSVKDENLLDSLVKLVNEYKNFIEYDLIFCAEDDFLFRQKGQTKIDNSVLEEFLPYLWDERLVKNALQVKNIKIGPTPCYAGLNFGKCKTAVDEKSFYIKTKNQDFAVAQEYSLDITSGLYTEKSSNKIYIPYIAVELKTYLEKNMLQEAMTTSDELKRNVPSSKYILACESINMSVSDADMQNTNIDEIIILRKAKRPRSNYPKNSRKDLKTEYLDYLYTNPLSKSGFERIIHHMNQVFDNSNNLSESELLSRGYF